MPSNGRQFGPVEVVITDFLLAGASFILAVQVKYDFAVQGALLQKVLLFALIVAVIKISVFYLLKTYKIVWQFVGMVDLVNAAKVTAATSILLGVLALMKYGPNKSYLTVVLLDALFTFVLIGGLRTFLRYRNLSRRNAAIDPKNRKKTVIYGAGSAGEKVYREIRDDLLNMYEVVGFLDDDGKKSGLKIHGMPVIGSLSKIKDLPDLGVEEVLIALPSVAGDKIKRIVEECAACSLKFQTVPVIEDIISGNVGISSFRPVSYEDLLRREPVKLDKKNIGLYLSGKRVLVTGAGGSIGSELCRQIIKYSPDEMVLLDIAENRLYDIEMHLKSIAGTTKITPFLADIKNRRVLEKLFGEKRPDVVFHAAAYKHVPMLQLHPWEAVLNNVLGTWNLLEMAKESIVKEFVFVSTDKAVNPANLLGASKRMGELLTICSANTSSSTKFMTVRFGNVIGSDGSVLPLFMKQIEAGGPVTVTHQDMTRYFMTISEAAQLILQAGALGKGGETFVLDMGEPVRLMDVAKDLIKLYAPAMAKDIDIKVIGLRPGEKMHEELYFTSEKVGKTVHDKINFVKNQEVDCTELYKRTNALLDKAAKFDTEGIETLLKNILPEYRPE